MKKMKFLTLLAVLTLLTVPAQATRNCDVVRHCDGQVIVCRCPRLTYPEFYYPRDDAPSVPDTPSVPRDDAPSVPDTPSVPRDDAPAVPDTVTPTVPDASASVGDMSEYELAVVRLVNVERARYGLPALTADADLSRVARYKSRDMRDKGYFSHESPTYGTPFQMMKSFGITYRTAGENIAYGYSTPQKVVEAWMNSEGHRANILNASYTRLGVGYVADGHYWTQMFVG